MPTREDPQGDLVGQASIVGETRGIQVRDQRLDYLALGFGLAQRLHTEILADRVDASDERCCAVLVHRADATHEHFGVPSDQDHPAGNELAEDPPGPARHELDQSELIVGVDGADERELRRSNR